MDARIGVRLHHETRAAADRTSFHSLRHTHASLWINDGGDVITLSTRPGHGTPT